MSNEMTRQSIEQEIRVKCLKDAEYRQQLIANPKSVIEAEFGLNIPENVEIEVQEETANKLIISIPPAPLENDNDLSEAELETVAGGIVAPDSWMTFGFCRGGITTGMTGLPYTVMN